MQNNGEKWKTRKEKIISQLENDWVLDLQSLMVEMGYSNKYEILEDIESIAKTLLSKEKVLLIEPPQCIACGFEFDISLSKLKIPSKCPQCKQQRISWPRICL